MAVKINLGTLIHGTLRNEDLLQAFESELSRIRGFQKHQKIVGEARAAIRRGHNVGFDWAEANENFHMTEIVNDLMDALNEYAPDGYYFGSIEGDGADFGFWQDEEN
jgi:hypothetical protein